MRCDEVNGRVSLGVYSATPPLKTTEGEVMEVKIVDCLRENLCHGLHDKLQGGKEGRREGGRERGRERGREGGREGGEGERERGREEGRERGKERGREQKN